MPAVAPLAEETLTTPSPKPNRAEYLARKAVHRSRQIPAWLKFAAVAWVVIVLILVVPYAIHSYWSWRLGIAEAKARELPQQQKDLQAKLEREARNAQMTLSITGPASLQPGAVNTYMLETRTLADEPAASKLSISVKDKSGKPVGQPVEIASQGKHPFTVPLPAALGPDEEWTLEVSAEHSGGDGKPITLSEKLPLERPGYLTHLFTDKPLYQPGEVVGFRSLTLERFSLQPVEEDLQLSFTITDPAATVVARLDGSALLRSASGGSELLQGPDGKAIRGIGTGEWAVPQYAPGGEYTLTVSDLRGRFLSEKRHFLINRYQPPRLHKELEFTRRSYGPGDEVLAACSVKRIEGGKPVAEQPVTATVMVDGKRIGADGSEKDDAKIELKTDAQGAVAVRFKLPKTIDYGEASLSVQFTDGGNVETIVRPIPIIIRRLRVDFYPEGGDLVAGEPNRVYFQSRTPIGKPAELKGHLLDSKGQAVAEVQTLADEKEPAANQGMGTFTFTPQAGEKYELKIDSPAGIKVQYPLPVIKAEGVVLRVDSGVTNDAEPLKATVWSAGQKRKLLVAAYCRGRMVAQEEVTVNASEAKSVSLLPPSGIGGVYRITVFEDLSSATVSRFVPVAERLVFRQPVRRLSVNLTTDKPHYTPGDKVRLSITSTDETKKLAPAIALVSVVDKAAFSLVDDKTLRTIPTHFMLTSEIRQPQDLENADFLLRDNPLAATSVDLLLGTQGWRRFAEQDPEKFRETNGAEAERLLAISAQVPHKTTNKREVEAAAQPAIAEARQKAAAQVVKESSDLQAETLQLRTAEREWRDYSERVLAVGVMCLFMLIIVTAFVAVASRLEKPALGTGLPFSAIFMIACCTIVIVLIGIGTDGFKIRKIREAAARSESADVVTGLPASSIGTRTLSGAQGLPRGRETEMEWKMRPPPGAPPEAMKAYEGGRKGDQRPVELPKENKPDNVFKPTEPPPNANIRTDPAYATDKQSKPGESARRRYTQAQAQMQQRRLAANMTPQAEHSFRDMERGLRSLSDPQSLTPFVVREYAHVNTTHPDAPRADFTETVYWHPVLILGNGESFVSFQLSDALTSLQALAFIHTTDGRLGAAKMEFASRLPFSLEAKLPTEITGSDELHIPVTVANDTDEKRDVHLELSTSGLSRMEGEAEAHLKLDAQKRDRLLFKLKPGIDEGEARLKLAGRSDFLKDSVERTIRVTPEGFPMVGVCSGRIDRFLKANVVLPDKYSPGSLKLRAEVFPSILADIQTGLEGMLQEPHGCFEQTSSTTYPNLLVLDYLQETGQSRPDIARRALDLIDRGYKRLVTFECPKEGGGRQGFEWFGGPVPHEALTAYGLLEFHDMAKVYDKVDADMVERTRKFLLKRRDGKGNFTRHEDHHHFGRVSQAAFNAYILWALTESEADADLNTEANWLIQHSDTSEEPYVLALTANCLFLRNNKAEGTKILDKLAKLQTTDGYLNGHESIVGAYGRDLQIEATALAMLAWCRGEQPQRYREPLQKAARWLMQQRSGYGGFGSTQATIMSLKALAQIAKDSRKLTPGDVIVSVRGNPVLRQSFAATAADTLVLEIPQPEKLLKPGDNEVRIELTGNNELPAKLSWSYHTLQPPSAENCPIKLSTKLDREQAREGETVRLTVAVENSSSEGQSMTVAIIGLPSGLALPEDLKQLRELAKPRTPLAGKDTPQLAVIDYFEIRGRELVLYWRGLDAGQKVEFALDLVARIPGKYRGPASRAYLYYGADAKCWAAPMQIAIVAK